MPVNPPLQDTYDIVIVGSGGGGMTAALAAKRLGKSAVILEKQDVVGGSTSFSGGVWWIPNNSLLAEAGIADSFDKSWQYLESVVEYRGPAVTPQRWRAFLNAGPRMIDFLRGIGLKVRRPGIDWPDYHDEVPGGLPEGRSLLPEPMDLNDLGEWKNHIGTYPPSVGLPLSSDEFNTLFLLKRTWRGKMMALRYAALMVRDKLLGRVTVCNGAAIQGRMLLLALRDGVEIQRNTPVKRFIMDGNDVRGVVVERDGAEFEVVARDGVIINVGGFARDGAFRKEVSNGANNGEATSANPGDTGEVVHEMIRIGAATDSLDQSWWVVSSRNIDGSWPKGAVLEDGRVLPFMHHLDISLPHCMLVDPSGRRFADESGSYMVIGEHINGRLRDSGKPYPCWAIFDRRHRDRYPWGALPPGQTPREWIDSGYMKKADSLEEIAALCGIDPAGLLAEAAKFNGFCRSGVDTDFGRGSRVFDRSHGDPSVKPNPNLGAIEKGPFYAVQIVPGDVGTAGGVVTDEYARVLREDGSPIGSLYAVGNCAAPFFGRCYPGAGANIGASFAFGYIAIHHAAKSNELDAIIN